MNDQASKMNLSGIPKPSRPLSEEEIGRQYIEGMIVLPVILRETLAALREVADSMSVLSLYYEKKGLDEKLFTEDELTGDENE